MKLSYINTQLREELCAALDLDESDLAGQLASIDYHYDEDLNQFR